MARYTLVNEVRKTYSKVLGNMKEKMDIFMKVNLRKADSKVMDALLEKTVVYISVNLQMGSTKAKECYNKMIKPTKESFSKDNSMEKGN